MINKIKHVSGITKTLLYYLTRLKQLIDPVVYVEKKQKSKSRLKLIVNYHYVQGILDRALRPLVI